MTLSLGIAPSGLEGSFLRNRISQGTCALAQPSSRRATKLLAIGLSALIVSLSTGCGHTLVPSAPDMLPVSVNWPTPEPIPYGTALGSAQLDATASVPGVFSYTPSMGTILTVGSHQITASFTPGDPAHYSSTTAAVTITVLPVPAQIAVIPSNALVTVNTATQLVVAATYANGATSSLDTDLTWQSASPDVASIANSGAVTCLRIGVAHIVATYASLSANSTVACEPQSLTITQPPFSTLPDEFVGPFASWVNVQMQFGAKGDGISDETSAFQNALEALHWYGPSVLWIPSGTYRITHTITLVNQDVSIIGEDPENTRIVWDGPGGQTMFSIAGGFTIQLSRLTLDGSGTADTGVSVNSNPPSSFTYTNQLSDMVFTGMNTGIRIGPADSTSIDRARFLNLGYAGVSVEDYNALDVWVRDSFFSGCARGLTNWRASGHFHVYNSVFVGSTIADMEIGQPVYFGERGNISYHSQAFIIVVPSYTDTQPLLTVEDNIIVDPLSSPFVMNATGPLMLIDNTILMPTVNSGPIVMATQEAPAATDIAAIGNVVTTANIMAGTLGRTLVYGNTVVARNLYKVVPPVPAAFLPNLHRLVVEVSTSASTQQIQDAVDSAAAMNVKAVVHVPAGGYSITKTIQVPGGSDIQVVGDGWGYNTQLNGTATDNQPTLLIKAPGHATLRQIAVNGSVAGDGVLVEANDIPGSRVVLSHGVSGGATGVYSDGLDQTVVEARNWDLDVASLGAAVVGGPTKQAGLTSFGRYSNFGGFTWIAGSYGTSYDVQGGAAVTIQDNWRDAVGSPNYIDLTDEGSITIQGGHISDCDAVQPVVIDGFKGSVAILGAQLMGSINISGSGSNLVFLGLGDDEIQADSAGYLIDSVTGGQVSLLLSGLYDTMSGPVSVPNQGPDSEQFIEGLLSGIRHIRSLPLLRGGADLTDVRLDHVQMSGGRNALHIVASSAHQPVRAYAIVAAGAAISSVNGTAVLYSGETPMGWELRRLNDGSFALVDPSTGFMLDADLSLRKESEGALSSNWLVLGVGDGSFSICNPWSGLCLSADPTQHLLQVTPQGEGGQRWRLLAN